MPMQLCSCSTSLLLASNNICLYFQKSSDMLNKNTLGVKKGQGQSEAALQTGATKNFDISRVTYQKFLNY